MKYRTRTNYSESQKALMWERWQKGDSLQQIALQGIVRCIGVLERPRHRKTG